MTATRVIPILMYAGLSVGVGADNSTVSSLGTYGTTWTTSPFTTPQAFSTWADYWFTSFLAAVCLITGAAIMCLNLFVFSFYVLKRDNILHTMYMILSVSDIISGIGAVLQATALLVIVTNELNVGKYIIPLSFFFTSLTTHVSVFFSTMLVFIRTINIIYPLHQVNNVVVFLCVVSYPIFWTVIIGFEIGSTFWEGSDQFPPHRQAYYFLVAPNPGSEILYRLYADIFLDHHYVVFILCAGVPYFVPSALTLLCCVVQIMTLNKIKIEGKAAKRNHKITITILQLTLVFFICNTAHFTTLFIFEVSQPNRNNPLIWYLLFIVSNILPFLNSLLNPFILIIRGRTLREFVVNILRGFGKRHSSYSDEIDRTHVAGEDRFKCTQYGGTTFMNSQRIPPENVAMVPVSKSLKPVSKS